jgi:hypothetical protein
VKATRGRNGHDYFTCCELTPAQVAAYEQEQTKSKKKS